MTNLLPFLFIQIRRTGWPAVQAALVYFIEFVKKERLLLIFMTSLSAHRPTRIPEQLERRNARRFVTCQFIVRNKVKNKQRAQQ